MVGTPLFMAPEQALAEVEPSGATDRYALGLIAYRLLFGRPYWRTHAIAQLLNEVLYVPMPAPSTRESHFGAPFDAWFARACAREPRARFTSAAEQVEALAAALNVEVLPIAIDPTQSVERGNPPSNAETRALELAPTLQMSASTVSGARGRASQLPSAPARRAAVLVAIGVAILAVVTIALRTSPVPTPPSIATAPSPRAVIDASVSPALPPSPSVAEVLSPAPPPAPSTAPSAKPALSARPATSASLSPLPRSTPKAAPSSAKPAPSLDPFADQK
jgi:serine/threonine-protein kinase